MSKIMFYERRNTRKMCVNFQPQEDIRGPDQKRDPSSSSPEMTDFAKKSTKGIRCKGCNYLEEEHAYNDTRKPWYDVKNWRSDLHLETVDFGKTGINRKIRIVSEVGAIDKMADLTIVADDTHPVIVVEHLIEDWDLNLPNICISVVGTTGRPVNMLPRYLMRLKQGLLRAVCSTSCWILTGGTNQGVDAITCDALKDAQMTSWMGTAKAPSFKIIGIANWNRISQHAQISKWILNTGEETDKSPFEYHMRRVTFDHETGERFPAFNPICSYFVGVESGIHASKGTEVFVRSALEELIQSDPSDSTHFNGVGLNIPTVLILIGGDFDTFERAANAVERDIPIILCEGTGMATDIIAVAIRLSQKNSNYKLNADQESSLVKIMEHHLSPKPVKGKIFPAVMFEGSRHLPFLRKCVRYRKLVFFYRVDLSVSHLDVAIMRALLKSGPARRRDPVQLAVHWNRCDEVVEDHLSCANAAGAPFTQKQKKPESRFEAVAVEAEKIAGFDINEKENIKELVTQALVEDKVEFIKLFLEHGLDIAKYLTTDQLAKIYSHACDHYPPLLKLLKRARNGKSKPYFKIKHVYNLIQICTSARPKHILKTLPDSGGDGQTPGARSQLRTFEDPFRELCIWAILTDKMEMSKFFWSRSKTPLMLALICSRLWEAHKTVVPPRDEETRAGMVENSKYYLKMASEMVDLAWHVNREMAADLVTYKYRGFERTNLMDLAAFIEAKEFIAHPLLQVAIDNLWKGGLTASLKQVLIAFLLPFRIPVFFRDQEKPATEEKPPPEKKSNNDTQTDSPLFTAVASTCGAAAVTAITRETIFETDIDEMEADKENMGMLQRSKSDKRTKKINDFLQEDEETQRHLKAKRDLIRKAEVAKKEALKMEKKRLLETSNQGDVFIRAAAALRRIQQLKELTLKETHSSNASLLDEDDSDQDSGVEGDHVKGNAATGRTIPDDDQFDITDDAELQDSDDQLDIDILAQDRERQQEQDNDLCKYQVKNLDDVEDEGGSRTQDQTGTPGSRRDFPYTPLGSSLINRWKSAKFRSSSKKAMASPSMLPESINCKDQLESKNTSQWSLAFPKNIHNKASAHQNQNNTLTIDSITGFDNLSNSRLSLNKLRAFRTADGLNTTLPIISSSILKPTSHQSGARDSETSSTSGESKCRAMSTKTMLYTFYTSPIAKFCMHTIAYLVFLAFFTISTIDTGQGMKSVWGMVSFQFMVCYALEAYRQLVTQRASWGMKLRIWAMSEWNIIEVAYLSMGLVSFPLTSWEWTRNTAIMMNCGINMLMWVRLLRFYQCSSKLGPMWIMIRKMMAETLWFLAIFTVLILSCGIFIFAVNVPEATPSQPAYYPIEKRNFNQPPAANATNGAPDIRLNRSQDGTDYDYDYYYDYGAAEQAPAEDLFYTKKSWIFLRPYLMSLGNQFLQWTYGGRNARVTVWSCFFFVVIGNALMLNLLVAIYGGIFNEIVQKADIEWKTEMYWLMKDFESKTFLPPPISIVETFGLWLYFITRGRKKPVPPKTPAEDSMINSLEILEAYCVQTILDTQEKEKTALDVTSGVIKNREISCGKIHETIQTVDDLRKEVNKRNMEKQEKKRDKMRRELQANPH